MGHVINLLFFEIIFTLLDVKFYHYSYPLWKRKTVRDLTGQKCHLWVILSIYCFLRYVHIVGRLILSYSFPLWKRKTVRDLTGQKCHLWVILSIYCFLRYFHIVGRLILSLFLPTLEKEDKVAGSS